MVLMFEKARLLLSTAALSSSVNDHRVSGVPK